MSNPPHHLLFLSAIAAGMNSALGGEYAPCPSDTRCVTSSSLTFITSPIDAILTLHTYDGMTEGREEDEVTDTH